MKDFEDEGAPAEWKVTESPEEVEAFWAARRPAMEAQNSAVHRLVPTLVGRTEAEARELVCGRRAES